MSASAARLRKVLSTPKITSPSGSSAVRIAWFSVAPASPAGSTFTFTPVSAVNASSTSSETANESWVTSVSLSSSDELSEQPAATITATARAASTRRMSVPLGIGLDGEHGPVLDPHFGDGVGQDVADATCRPGLEVFAFERVPEPARANTARRPSDGEQ